jgi:acyl-CoA reductase-like NAD-dependent aldehyde dehydrogenase
VGVVACLAPDTPALLGIVSLIAPPLCAGNTVVALASPANPLPAAALAEALATSDLPPGVVNLLTGDREELAPHAADHRDIDAVHAATVPHDTAEALRLGAADNLKRVTVRENLAARDFADAQRCTSPRWIEPFVEIKTIWHPSAT